MVSSVKKALTKLSDYNSVKKLSAVLGKETELLNYCTDNGISRNNLIIEVISAIFKSSGDGREGQLAGENFKTKYNRYVMPVFCLSIAFLIFSVVMLFQGRSDLFLAAVIALALVLMHKVKSDNVLADALGTIGELYIPVLCDAELKRFNRTMETMKSVASKLDSEIAYLKSCSENSDKSQKFALKTNQNLDDIIAALQKIYDFSVEESKKSPFDALGNLNKSVDKFNAVVADAKSNYNENMQLYRNCLSNINDLGKVEASVALMSKKTIESVDKFSDTYIKLAESIKSVMEAQLGEFVSDSKFTFSNLNMMSAEIYEKMKAIFSEHVETSNKMCQIADNGFKEIISLAENMHNTAVGALDNMVKTNENIEKAVMALCAANYKLVDVLENNDAHEANSSMKQFLNESKYNLSDYFQSVTADLDDLTKKVDAALTKKTKGDE
ncbi:MAG: hypothetical protein J6A05_07470 [Oscillospiraceae bacterium]|nr:hypothetical protein [Clostridia bacterium]MBP1549829.1 hypothetical protein [Oscillospiraceae bacterium]